MIRWVGNMLLAIVVISTMTNIASSQLYIQAGLNASAQRAKFNGINIDSERKPGFHVGLFSNIQLIRQLSFQPGILYSSKGLAGRDAISSFNYIEVPAHLHYRFNENEGAFIEAGFYFAMLISARSQGYNVSDDAHLEDFGGNFGVGYHFKKVSIGLRANQGLINIARVRQTVVGEVTNYNMNAMLYFAIKIF
ncbi:MAG TPA: porin family protein [Saprospiraceae bacterium]|nr:porin family protein [Saprospiraceae bacterium]